MTHDQAITSQLTAASPHHAAAMAHIHGSAFAGAAAWSAAVFSAQLSVPGAFGWLASDGGLVLARVAADEAEILTLAVTPGTRRAGLGRGLLRAAQATAAAMGATSMLLEVAESNQPARALYAGEGYFEVGRRRRYYDDGDDALVLRRSLQAASDRPA